MNISDPWYTNRSIFRPLRPYASVELGVLFPRDAPLEVELGAGDGSFVLPYAQKRPDLNLIAVERLLGRARKIERRARRNHWSHLVTTRLEASHMLNRVLPASCVHALHIYFPDPWPKKRHATRRLVSPGFPEIAARILRPGGCLHLRTDNVPYFEQMNQVFDGIDHFVPHSPTEEITEIRTTFERGFNAQGIPTNYLTLQFQP